MHCRIICLMLFLIFYCIENAHALSGLRVKCDQEGAEIILNDKIYGQCPKNITTPSGTYRVVLKKVMEDKSYYYFESTVTLTDNEIEKIEAKLDLVYPETYHYEKVKSSNSAAAYQEYLKSRPDGEHADEIRQILNEMETGYVTRAREMKDLNLYREYKESFPNGQYIAEIEELHYYSKAKGTDAESDYKSYFSKYPDGKFAGNARERLNAIEDDYFNKARKSNQSEDYEAYLLKYSNGRYSAEAKKAIIDIEDSCFAKADNSKDIPDYDEYLKRYPKGRHAEAARNGLEDAHYAKAKNKNTKEALQEYMNKYPAGRHLAAAGDLLKLIYERAIEMVFVKGGCYEMGDTFIDGVGQDEEKPVHDVCVNDFFVGKYEVTIGEFKKFADETGYMTEAEKNDGCNVVAEKKWKKGKESNWKAPGFIQDEKHPVVCVSWNDAQEYINWLKSRTGKGFRFLTESEWEYMARSGGKDEKYSGFSNNPEVSKYANICDSNCELSDKASDQNDGFVNTSKVGTFQPNGLGIYDVSGNVWEWVSDWYAKNYYENSPKNNPEGPSNGEARLLRGGSWSNVLENTRTAFRGGSLPGNSGSSTGFRIARNP